MPALRSASAVTGPAMPPPTIATCVMSPPGRLTCSNRHGEDSRYPCRCHLRAIHRAVRRSPGGGVPAPPPGSDVCDLAFREFSEFGRDLSRLVEGPPLVQAVEASLGQLR